MGTPLTPQPPLPSRGEGEHINMGESWGTPPNPRQGSTPAPLWELSWGTPPSPRQGDQAPQAPCGRGWGTPPSPRKEEDGGHPNPGRENRPPSPLGKGTGWGT